MTEAIVGSENDTPSWLAGHPLIFMGSWDNTPIFRVRRGVSSPVRMAEYPQRRSPEAVEAMAKLGVNLVVIDFMKCFGLQAELPIAEGQRPFIQNCHDHGIKVGAYVGSTIGYETFLLERPDAEEWLVRDPMGGYRDYQDPPDRQSFRARMYFQHPGYREYIKQVLTSAIVDFGFDEIHFDSASVMAQDVIFYHPRAITDFRRYLTERFTPDALKDYVGFSDPSAVLPPRTDVNGVIQSTIHDPLMQVWTRFRCDMLIDYFAEMRRHIRGLNPEVAISVNTVEGISTRSMELGGVDHSALLPLVDLLWNEEPDVAGVQSGVLVSRIRSYKMVTGAGKRMMTYTGGGGMIKRQLAESMMYNRETIGDIGDPLGAEHFPEDQLPYVQFFREQFDCFKGVESVADVAVLHSFNSMLYNYTATRESSLTFEQSLIQGKILFDIIFDERLKDLSRYKVLVLPDQECVFGEQLELIRAFVNAGGGLVATEDTSRYNDRRQPLAAFGLQDLFGIATPPAESDPIRRTVGSGRVVYIPAIIREGDFGKDPHYRLAKNSDDLIDSVSWAANDQLTLDVDAPPTITTELTRNAAGDRYFIHLLNFSDTPPVEAINLRLRIPENRQVVSAEVLAPGTDAQTVAVNRSGDFAECSVESLDTYAVVRVTFA